jgi:hypothetical protein
MKRLLLLVLIATSFTLSSKAQSGYSTAVGVRLSSSVPVIKNGITFKQFLGKNAVEAILSFGDGAALCGLYEVHKPLGVPNLQWLIGAGGYIGLSSSNKNVGLAGIIGLDYKVPTLPVNLTVDWKPELNLAKTVGFEASGVGFSARFTF